MAEHFPDPHEKQVLKHGKTIYLILVLVQKYSAAIFPISMNNYVDSLGQTLNILFYRCLPPPPQEPFYKRGRLVATVSHKIPKSPMEFQWISSNFNEFKNIWGGSYGIPQGMAPPRIWASGTPLGTHSGAQGSQARARGSQVALRPRIRHHCIGDFSTRWF